MSYNYDTYINYISDFPFYSLDNVNLQNIFNDCSILKAFFSKLLPFSNIENFELVSLQNNDGHTFPIYISPSEAQEGFDCCNKLSVLNVNIRSINANFHKLEILLNQMKFSPAIICLSETWLNEKKPFLYSLRGYDFYSRPGCNRAGGTAMFIKSELDHKIINNLELKLSRCEDLWAEITLSENNKITIGSIYRHPSYDFNQFQNKLIANFEHLNNQHNKFLIVGDININLLNYTKTIEDYKNEIKSQGTLQTVQTPTRISCTNNNANTNSLLDHVYTNISENHIKTQCMAYDISDHLPVITVVGKTKIKKTNLQKRIIRDLSKFQPDEFLSELQKEINRFNFDTRNANDLWDRFDLLFNTIVNKHAPTRPQTRREIRNNAKPYITKGILKSIKNKQKLFKKALKYPTQSNWDAFKNYRNKLTRTIKASKQVYFKTQIKNNKYNTKKLWNVLNSIVNLKQNNKSHKSPTISTAPDTIISDPYEVANLFNEYFANVGTNLSKLIKKPSNINISPPDSREVRDSLFLKPITEQEIITYISQLNNNKSTISTCCPTKFIKLAANIIAPSLAKIFNLCIQDGIFPDKLKISEVIPIFKKGDNQDLTNHRPISLLSPFSKLLERHIHTEITNWINKYNLLTPYQYGFRKNSSTEQAITQIAEEISENMQNGYTTCTVFLDFRKAFDTIDHQILLSKLYKFGIRGLALKLIGNYLNDRKQFTKINNIMSEPQQITCGIPQGSILGPLLFNLYINNLPKISKFSVRLFADDACLTLRDKNVSKLENLTNQELIKINNWRKLSKLSINYSKSNYIIFSKTNDNKQYNISIEGNILERVKEVRYLGVYIDEKLSWKSHINKLKSKLISASYILSKLRYCVDIPTLKMVYFSLVYPKLNYCVTAWGGIAKSNLQPIVNLQKKIIRIITYKSYISPTKPIFLQLKTLPFNSIYMLNLSILMYKIQNKLITGSYNLIKLDDKHNYNTRLATNNNFFQNYNKTNIGKSTCSAQGSKLWTTIPTNIKSLPLHLFKNKMKEYLLSSLKEGIT